MHQTATPQAATRPIHYRKSRWWVPALRALAGKGWSDREIAEALCDLSPEAVERLVRGGDWRQAAIEKMSDPGTGGRWTRRQVQYHRRRLGLAGRNPELQCAVDDRLLSRRLYQARMGWGHLLPEYDEDRKRWLPGHELQKREVDILCALRDRGSLTAAELGNGKRLWASEGMGCLTNLVCDGLVIVSRTRPRLYALMAPDRPLAWRLPTGVELACRALGIV